jgi:transcriptional regulator with XRE-family HTH domain
MVRHARRLSQVELARQVGITQKHLSQIETSARPFLGISSGTIVRLSQVLNVPTDFLLGLSDEMDEEIFSEPAVVDVA